MMDSHSGALELLKPNDPRIDNPPAGMVIMHGTEPDVRRVAHTVAANYDAKRAKAKRKAQRASRKRNR